MMNTHEQRIIWVAIIAASATSWLLRALPLFLVRNKFFSESSQIFIFLTYCSYAILGSLIYSIAFGNKNIVCFFTSFQAMDLIKITIIFVAFLLACRIKNAVVVFFTCLALYALSIFFMM